MRHHILIIEDDDMVRSFIQLHLENEGHRVTGAGTGEDGIAALAADAADLVLLDLNLPDGDGLSIAQRIREVSEVPIIVLTTRAGKDDRLLALGLGADEYLTKPIEAEELLLRVRNMLRRFGHPVDATAPPPIAPTVAPSAPAAPARVSRSLSVTRMVAGGMVVLAVVGGVAWWWSHRGAETSPPVAATTVDQPLPTAAEKAGSLPEVSADQPLAATSYSWVLRSKCDDIPDVSWWRAKTKADVVGYVNRRYAGDWKPYIQDWTARLIDLRDSYSRHRGVKTPTGEVLSGDSLKALIDATQKRVDVLLCLSREAAEYSYKRNQPVR